MFLTKKISLFTYSVTRRPSERKSQFLIMQHLLPPVVSSTLITLSFLLDSSIIPVFVLRSSRTKKTVRPSLGMQNITSCFRPDFNLPGREEGNDSTSDGF